MSRIQAAVVAGLAAAGVLGAAGEAAAGSYGRYTYSASRGYGYRTYSYYSVTHRAYHHHVAVYRPTQPRYVYYYNSQTRVYWGRYDLDTGRYQLLPAEHKRGTLADIPESAFPAGGPLPAEGPGSDEPLLPPPETADRPAPASTCGR